MQSPLLSANLLVPPNIWAQRLLTHAPIGPLLDQPRKTRASLPATRGDLIEVFGDGPGRVGQGLAAGGVCDEVG
jgi:hypothetical protein